MKPSLERLLGALTKVAAKDPARWNDSVEDKTSPETLYHGSPKKIKQLKPMDLHGDPKVPLAVFGSPSRDFALAYAGGKWGDRDLEQSLRVSKSGGPHVDLQEMRPGVFKELFDRPGYMYELPVNTFRYSARHGDRWEQISTSPVVPTKTERLGNVLRAMEKSPHISLSPYTADAVRQVLSRNRRLARVRELPLRKRVEYLNWYAEKLPQELAPDMEKFRKKVTHGRRKTAASQTKDPARWNDPVVFSPNAKLTKKDLHDYYAHRAIKKRILDAVGDTETIVRQSFDPQNMILRRKDGAGRFIKLKDEYDRWNQTRMSEVHPTFGSKVDFVLADIDPQAKVPWNKTKAITETVAKTMAGHPDVKNVEVRFSGGRGFYVKGTTKDEMHVDNARALTQKILQGIAARPDITFGKADEDQIRLDTSPLKRRGSVRAPYSLNTTTGLVSAPVSIEDLPNVQKADFTMDRILEAIRKGREKKSSAEFAPGIPKNKKVETLPRFVRPRDWTMVVQTHDAKRAGKHWDLRLVDPKTNLAHSFAVPKGRFPGKKDRMLLAVQQPTHTADYALNFEGDIPAGTYGAGTVKQTTKENAQVLKSNDDKIQFVRPGGQRYTLFRTCDTNWGIIRQ